VGLRRREEDVDLIERGALPCHGLAERERVLQPALVGDQHTEGDLSRNVDALQHRGGVG
jgi:hypothetical protein